MAAARLGRGGFVSFHDVHDPAYGVLSPLSPHPLVVRHVQYPSLHHYFLSERFSGSAVAQELATAASVWAMDRLVKTAEESGSQRGDWSKVKIDVMMLGSYFKFKQNEGPRRVLLDTQDATLVFHSPTDDFWGDGGDGTGKNVLGVITMAVRSRLAAEEERRRGGKGSGVAAASRRGTGVSGARATQRSQR